MQEIIEKAKAEEPVGTNYNQKTHFTTYLILLVFYWRFITNKHLGNLFN
jgi:hypothetical protein